jgi:5'-phosphate synthase pdxT subunit
VQSFIADVDLHFLESIGDSRAFPGVFIRAPVVEKLLSSDPPGSKTGATAAEVLAVFPQKTQDGEADRIVAVRQGNVLGTSFHPELTDDIRMHVWWLDQALTPIFQQQNA